MVGGGRERWAPDARGQGKRKALEDAAAAAPRVYNLKEMLEELMNAAVDATKEPYKPISPAYLPAYVELLLRAGIAVKHPRDPTLWKLVDFHL